ncbi:MAG: hypothetical protein WCP79_10905 [Bacillota bacterium]
MKLNPLVYFGLIICFFSSIAQSKDISVAQFGALANGIDDDAPAIRRALAFAQPADCIVFPAGVYLLQSGSGYIYGDNEYLMVMKTGIKLRGEGKAQLKIADGAAYKTKAKRGMAVIFAENCDGISLKNISIDQNGVNNIVPNAGRQITGYAVRLHNCTNTKIDSCEFINNYGQNTILISGYKSKMCEITNNVIINGGTSIPGNKFQDDYSAIYSCAQMTNVTGNRISNDIYPFANSGAVEIHNSDSVVANNVFEKCQPAIYICSDFINQTVARVVVHNNKIIQCNRGIFFDGKGDFAKIEISDNYFLMNKFQANSKFSLAAAIQTRRTDSLVYDYTQRISNLRVTGNEMAEEFTAIPDKASACFARIASIHGAVFQNNRVANVSGSAIVLMGSPFGMKDILFVDNEFRNFGLNSSPYGHAAIDLYFSGSSLQPLAPAFNADNLGFFNNSFSVDKKYTGEYYGFSAGFDKNSKLTNLVYGGNSFAGVLPTAKSANAVLEAGELSDSWQILAQNSEVD